MKKSLNKNNTLRGIQKTSWGLVINIFHKQHNSPGKTQSPTRRSLFSDVARSSSILACGVALQWRRALAPWWRARCG